MRWQILLAGAGAVWFLFRNLPQGLLFFFPGLLRARETDDDGSLDPARWPAMEHVERALGALGFARAGAIEVRPPLSAPVADLVYSNAPASGLLQAPALHAFADVGARGGAIEVTFFTPFQDGRAVLTSDFRRPTVERKGYLAGGLPGTDVPELWAVHRRRVEHFEPGVPATPWSDFSAAGRVLAEEAVLAGPGRKELRGRSASAALVSIMALALLVFTTLQLLRLA